MSSFIVRSIAWFLSPFLIIGLLLVLIFQGCLWMLWFLFCPRIFPIYYRLLSLSYVGILQSANRTLQAIEVFLPFLSLHFLKQLLSPIGYRVRRGHCHILGKTGAGKSVVLEQLIWNDIENGYGVAVFDPHGQLIEKILHFKLLGISHPRQHFKRVVLLDFESDPPSAFNFLKIPPSKNNEQKSQIISAITPFLIEAFQITLKPEMSDSMRHTLFKVLQAVLHLPKPCLMDVVQLLVRRDQLTTPYQQLLTALPNPMLRHYFQKHYFSNTTERSKEALYSRLSSLFAHQQLEESLRSTDSILDFSKVFSQSQIVLIKASQGRLGEELSRLIGTLVHQLLLGFCFRRHPQEALCHPFFIHMDECHNFMNLKIVKGIAEARKFGMFYTLVRQRLGQEMTKEEDKALRDCNLHIVGKTNYEDAKVMAKELGVKHLERRLLHLRTGQFFMRQGERRCQFIAFPKTFAMPVNQVGKKRHRKYMLNKECQKLQQRLK